MPTLNPKVSPTVMYQCAPPCSHTTMRALVHGCLQCTMHRLQIMESDTFITTFILRHHRSFSASISHREENCTVAYPRPTTPTSPDGSARVYMANRFWHTGQVVVPHPLENNGILLSARCTVYTATGSTLRRATKLPHAKRFI